MAMTMCSANLTDLPVELLDEIVSHLGYEDRVSLASAHSDLHFLRPKEQTVEGVTFTRHLTYHVALPILARGLIAVKLSFNSGLGDPQKIWLQLIREGQGCGEKERRSLSSYFPVLSVSKYVCLCVQGTGTAFHLFEEFPHS